MHRSSSQWFQTESVVFLRLQRSLEGRRASGVGGTGGRRIGAAAVVMQAEGAIPEVS